MEARQEWVTVRDALTGALSKEDQRLLELLIKGESTPTIARALGQHRSMIWRKAQRLRALASGGGKRGSA